MCIAVGATVLRSNDAGAHWKQIPVPPDLWYLGGISCPVKPTCVAVGTTNAASPQGLSFTTTDEGAHWTEFYANQPLGFSELSGVACRTTAMCSAVGISDNGGLALTSVDGGHSWVQSVVPGSVKNISAVQCNSTPTCVAVGTTDSAWSFLVSSDGGSTWVDTLAGPFGGGGLGLSCPKATFCVATGDTTTGAPVAFLSRSGGARWSPEVVPDGVGYLQAISCPTASACVTVGSTYASGSTAMATTDGGVTWLNRLQVTATELISISCPTAQECMSVGAQTTAWGGSTIGGAVTSTVDGGQTWDSTAPAVATGFSLYGVSCASTTRCVAVGESNSTLADAAFVTGDFGVTWTEVPLPVFGNLASVSCPTTTTCIAVGSHILASSDGGSTWTTQSSPGARGGLWSIFCSGAATCAAAGNDGAGNGVVLMTADGGTTWASQALPSGTPPLSGISCSTSTTCDAVGQHIVATADSGTTWVSAPSPGLNLQAIACPVGGPCQGVGVNEVFTGGP